MVWGEGASDDAGDDGDAAFGTIFEWSGARYAVIGLDIGVPPGLERLTSAEIEVARLVAAGLSNDAIAVRRGTSSRTVANQVAAILRKLSVRSRLGVVQRFAERRCARG